MAHPQTAEAVDAPVDDMDSAAAAIADLPEFSGEATEPVEGEAEAQEEEGDDLDLSEEEEEEGEEPAKPAIKAPVSLNAEEKAKFAQLPEEAQRYVADLESRRATQVQEATTKASEAQRTAEASAARADAEARARYAQQLDQFAKAIAPRRPDPAIANTDPGTYIALQAQYEAAKAEHDDFVAGITQMGQDAQAGLSQAEQAERDRQLMSIPEVQNEETREAFFTRGTETAKALGLDLSALGNASAAEWRALSTVGEWKDKATKYDAAMAKQMQRVRDGKRTVTTKPNAAQSSSMREKSYRDARARLRESGDVHDAAAAIARLG